VAQGPEFKPQYHKKKKKKQKKLFYIGNIKNKIFSNMHFWNLYLSSKLTEKSLQVLKLQLRINGYQKQNTMFFPKPLH
jgi:hypothetical protein